MSISFNPSQTRIILACEEYARASRLVEIAHTSDTLSACLEFVRTLQELKDAGGLEGQQMTRVTSEAQLVSRAWHRFLREFDAYRQGSSRMSMVRMYHRLLIDTLAPFKQ